MWVACAYARECRFLGYAGALHLPSCLEVFITAVPIDCYKRNRNIRENYRPLWRRSRTTNTEEQYTQSVEFYGEAMSLEEANEAERWWPQFLLDNTSLKGGEELLLPEITHKMKPYAPLSEVVCTDIEPVRVLYNGHNHYEALVLSSTHDTERMQWLRDKISVMAEPGLQSDPGFYRHRALHSRIV